MHNLDLQWTENDKLELYNSCQNYKLMVQINKDFLKIWWKGEVHLDSDEGLVTLSFYYLEL